MDGLDSLMILWNGNDLCFMKGWLCEKKKQQDSFRLIVKDRGNNPEIKDKWRWRTMWYCCNNATTDVGLQILLVE
jgi:hypothetical protein